VDLTGLKSKEFREAIDRAGRWLLYSATSLGACVLAAVGVAVGAVTWEIAAGFPPVLVSAIIALEYGVGKKDKDAGKP
jgi:hypothetical protein